MSKLALLIGCNYTNTPDNLRWGCIDDIENIQKLLVNVYGYSPNNIIVLRDDNTDPTKTPTKANILNELETLVSKSAINTEIWFHYSGHGSQARFNSNGIIKENGTIEDVIVPIDVIEPDGTIVSNNLISADTIHIYLKQISSKCRALFLFDSCHSGTLCELPYTFLCNPTNGLVKPLTSSTNTLACSNIYMMSGCQDNQTSENVYLSSMNEYVGAFTTAFIKALQKYNYSIDIKNLYSTICRDLKMSGNNQLPLLSSSNPSSRSFIFMPPGTIARPIPAIIPVASSIQPPFYVPTPAPTQPAKPPQKPAQKPNKPIKSNMHALQLFPPSRNQIPINMMANSITQYVIRKKHVPSIPPPGQRKIRNVHSSIYSNFRGLVARSRVIENPGFTRNINPRTTNRISLIFH